MMLCIGAFAKDSYIYWDKEIDLDVEIPNELQQTWTLSNAQSGFAVTVFNSDAEDAYLLAIGKVPLCIDEDEDVIDVLPLMLETFLFFNFTDQESNYLLEEVKCYAERLPPMEGNIPFSHRYRIHLYLEEIEEMIRLDIHLFTSNEYSCFVVTGGLNCHVQDDLDDFSEKIVQKMKLDN